LGVLQELEILPLLQVTNYGMWDIFCIGVMVYWAMVMEVIDGVAEVL